MRCLLAFNAVLAGDLSTAAKHKPAAIRDDMELGDLPYRVYGMLLRAESAKGVFPLDDVDLRGWHYVLTGAAQTRLAAEGYPEPWRGRHDAVDTTHASCRDGLVRLKTLLDAWGVEVPRVLHAEGAGSRILATAAAELWGVPLAPLDDGAGIVVLYDTAELSEEELEELETHRPGQVVYAHTTRWALPDPIVADVTTAQHRVAVPPWDDTADLQTEAGAVLAAGPMPADQLVAGDDLEGLRRLAPAWWTRGAAARTGGPRDRLWRSAGPVRRGPLDRRNS
jgi:hypothetical protein